MKEELIEFCKSMGIEYVGIASSGRYNDLRDILQKRADRDLSKVFDK
jgi:epoxyqueuosine reductase